MPRKQPPASLEALVNEDNGDTLALMKAARARVARALDETTAGRDVASLTRQFMSLTVDIAEYEAAARGGRQ